jgi:hypothetical protein
MVYDISIDGDGYILKPGAYQRFQDGAGESRIGRVRLFDFFGGGQRAAQLERDRFWHGDGAWPVFDSQGIIPGPKRTDIVEDLSGSDAFAPESRTWFTIWEGVCYVAQGDRLYRVTTDVNGAYDGLEPVQTLSAPVTGAVTSRGTWYFAHGDAAVFSAWDFEDESYDPIPLGNEDEYRTRHIGTHLGRIAYQTVGPASALRDSVSLHDVDTDTLQRRHVQAPVRAFVEHRGSCWFITERGLYRFTMGGVSQGNHSADYAAEATLPQVGYPDDLIWVVSHMGSLWLWLGKEVHRYDASDRIFEPMGLRGRETLGAASVGRYLVVNIERDLDGKRQLWAWDGRGWWLLDEEQGSGTRLGWPVALYGVANNADLLAGRGPSANHTGLWQFFERENVPAYRESMTLTSSLLDGGERDLEKVWRKIGAIFAWPDERIGTSPVTARIQYSVDGGQNWETAAEASISPGDRTAQVSGVIDDVVRSQWIQLRVWLEDIDDWAPVLMGLWAEHETLDLPVRRRRWRVTVQCRDTLVLRDGAASPHGAREIADRLWELWEDGAVTTFEDVDFAVTGEGYTVRIAAIREVVPNPTQLDSDASSEIELTLVEV